MTPSSRMAGFLPFWRDESAFSRLSGRAENAEAALSQTKWPDLARLVRNSSSPLPQPIVFLMRFMESPL